MRRDTGSSTDVSVVEPVGEPFSGCVAVPCFSICCARLVKRAEGSHLVVRVVPVEMESLHRSFEGFESLQDVAVFF